MLYKLDIAVGTAFMIIHLSEFTPLGDNVSANEELNAFFSTC